jgi:hypothetical protein
VPIARRDEPQLPPLLTAPDVPDVPPGLADHEPELEPFDPLDVLCDPNEPLVAVDVAMCAAVVATWAAPIGMLVPRPRNVLRLSAPARTRERAAACRLLTFFAPFAAPARAGVRPGRRYPSPYPSRTSLRHDRRGHDARP